MGILHLALVALTTYASAQIAPPPPATPSAPPPPACTAAEHRQFDFWVGSWDLYRTGQNAVVGRNLIEKLFGGCVIRETWTPRPGGGGNLTGGGSLNHYDPIERRWHQTWIDSSNTRVVFEGGLVGSKIVITGLWKDYNGPGQHGLVRMTYSQEAGNTLRQLGELSTDHGATWSPSFDFTYRKSSPQPGE